MPSSPFRDAPVNLKLTAGSPLAELFLVDHAFALVGRAIGELECAVEPGVYKVKARIGDAVTERLVVLDGDQAIDLSGDLLIGSAAPIEDTARTREQDMYAAAIGSADVAVRHGEGARLFVMARAWAGEGTSVPPPRVSVHQADGGCIADLVATDAVDSAQTTSLELDPGPYFVRWHDGMGVAAEQCVHAVSGWQTQVFVLEDAAEPAEIGRTRVSVLMNRGSFDPRDPALRRTEEARTALADVRKVAAGFLDEALAGKLGDPMLGLFGAHLMLIARDAGRVADEDRSSGLGRGNAPPRAPVSFEQSHFDAAVEGLGALIGVDHPDVVALSTQTTNAALDRLPPLVAPPLLWRSWVMLIEASNASPHLVPVSTWRRTLRLLPLRPFLLWSPEDEEAAPIDWTRGVARALATAKREPAQRPGGEGPLADLLADGAAEVSEAGASGVTAGDATRRRVSHDLLAPRAAIDAIAAPPSPDR